MMRLEIEFDRPLSADARLRLRLALGTLVKVRRIRVLRGDRNVLVDGEALARAAILEALKELDLVPSRVMTSLEEAADADADDTAKRERVRAIGR
jgi:hypothetical protein